jgi:uncharacterized membrane protein
VADPAGGHHHHGGGTAAPASRRLRVVLLLVMLPLVALTTWGLVLLWPAHVTTGPDVLGASAKRLHGTVLQVTSKVCYAGTDGSGPDAPATGPGDQGDAIRCPVATARLAGRGQDGRVVEAIVPQGSGTPRFGRGDRVVLSYIAGAPAGQQYEVVDFQRGRPLLVLAVAFAVVVVAAGRLRGVAALLGLGVSAAVLLVFVLPAILAGESPLLVAVVGSAAIMLVALFLMHGLSARTAVAVIGTTVSLALIGVLATVTVAASRFSGLGTEDVAFLRSAFGQVDVRGLLLAGIIIGSLGVLDDVTVTQTSAVWEIAGANPRLSAREVYTAGVRVGRDHVASTVNTLVLAYAGASLPLLLLFTVSTASAGDVLTTEIVAQEVLRALVGSIGIVAAVPVTTALATAAVMADRQPVEPAPGRGGRRRRPGRRAHPGH